MDGVGRGLLARQVGCGEQVLSAAEVVWSLCDVSPFEARETGSGRPHRIKKLK